MKIYGPYLDLKKPKGTKRWFLTYFAPVMDDNHCLVLDGNGKTEVLRHRPYYKTEALANADKDRIYKQYATAGSGDFLFNREDAADYDAARSIAGDNVRMVDLARFWRKHHPLEKLKTVTELVDEFLVLRRSLLDPKDEADRVRDLGRYYGDLASRCGLFARSPLGVRYPKTINRDDILTYLRSLKLAPRTVTNQKRCLYTFFAWVRKRELIDANPVDGIDKSDLPKVIRKEIRFLTLDQVTRYIRCAERYDPELVAHEIVQLFAGVRADDEMADFDASFVDPESRTITLPADVAKTEERDVIGKDLIEQAFWSWWSEYGKKTGLLRPQNHGPRWDRVRILSFIEAPETADEMAALPIKTLKKLPEAQAALERWPFNARRRTFCTYHVAKHQSANKTALILRHHGSIATLHNSYRGRGVSRAQGKAYFAILPAPVARPIQPRYVPRGIVKIQASAAGA